MTSPFPGAVDSTSPPSSSHSRSSLAAPLRRPIPRLFLERVSRALLARLVAPFEPALTRYDFSVEALAQSKQTDRAQVERLWTLLSAPPPDLVALHDDLLAIADVGTSGGQELLLSRDVDRVLDPELGAEDCAAIARLEHRALFDVARPQTAGQAQVKAFATYQPSAPRALPKELRALETFKRRMGEELVARGRTTHFKVHEWQSGSERHMELVYGKLASARDLLGKSDDGGTHEVTSQVTDRSTERAHALFHDDTFQLDVAGYEWMKELVRRIFGEAFFGSRDHFAGHDSITLAPFKDLAAALASNDVPDLKNVQLQRMKIALDGGGWIEAGDRGDCLNGAAGAFLKRALTEGTVVEATLLLYTMAKVRPFTLKLDGKRLTFDRRDPRVVRVVRDYLAARGFLRAPGTGDADLPGVPSNDTSETSQPEAT